ncbi:MAG: ribonuclease HII [Algibacter sp.]|uniref:ribonuclease HII n=1 Tax=Algibacter sp. TaxID=1872428 RepID=UPI0026265353|nr:ribonuclease HII [Algibacter sp.]MDG1730647.1 ribonuclease HII [Algibacter sp.]MDG2177598.1 ribonuclease HII [Algibacter sp.]
MRLFCFSLLLIFIFGCSKSNPEHSNLLNFVPKNTFIIIKASHKESLKSSINNSDFLQQISKTTIYENLEQQLKPLSNLNPSHDILICFSKDDNDSLHYSFITKLTKNLFVTDSLPNYTEEVLAFENKSIIKSKIDNDILYNAIIDSTFFASSSKTIVDNAFDNINEDLRLKKIYNTASNDKTFSMVLKPSVDFNPSFFIEDSLTFNRFTEYIAIDVELNQNDTYFNGITKATDSTQSLINIFKNTIPQVNQIQDITPSNSDGFMSFSFDDFKTFKANLSKFNKTDSIPNNTTLFEAIIEAGVIYEDENRAIVLNSTDVIATSDALLGEQTVADTYREIDIYKFSDSALFAETFMPLISANNSNLYFVLDNFFVFANNLEMLQNIIANYQNKTTVSHTTNFKDVKKKLSDASSLLQVTNASTLKGILNKNIARNSNYSLNSFKTSAIQFIYDNNFAHVNGIIKKNKTRASLNSVSEELNIKLDKDILITPQLVKNHITKQKEIVVQDINNNLYLISNKGKILWKKQLQGPVLGKIEQIDIYKNGRLQLAFATPNRIYVLDRNGKEVRPFSLKFNDEITQPLAVFDYDKRKNYRLLITQGKNVLMYDVKGKKVRGFTFKSANNTIICQPKHFRIGSKDYITLKTKSKLYILDRLGKTRVKPKQSFSYSNQHVFLYNNTFTTTTAAGDLISVDSRGNVSSRNLNLSKNHHIETTSKTLVAQAENKLTIKNKTTELDFGDYSNPKIFYINNKIYVSSTDLQSHKIYLFDSQSKLLPNFPVYGNSTIELDNIDKDNNLEFITKGEPNTIILYQIN